MQDKSCLSRAVCLVHRYKAYRYGCFDNHLMRRLTLTVMLLKGLPDTMHEVD